MLPYNTRDRKKGLNTMKIPVPFSGNISVPASPGPVWYQITLPSKGSIQADTLSTVGHVDNIGNENDTTLVFYNEKFQFIKKNDDVSASVYLSSFISHGLESGTYYICVLTSIEANWSSNNLSVQGRSHNGLTFHVVTEVYPQPPVPIPVPRFGFYNTGQSSTVGHVLSEGTEDLAWKIDKHDNVWGPKNSKVVNSYQWTHKNDNESTWIGYSGDRTADTIVSTSFDLTGYDTTTVTIDLEILVDGSLSEMRLNGDSDFDILYSNGTPSANLLTIAEPGHLTWQPITLNTGFQNGTNKLYFRFLKSLDPNEGIWTDKYPGGLRVRVVSSNGTLI